MSVRRLAVRASEHSVTLGPPSEMLLQRGGSIIIAESRQSPHNELKENAMKRIVAVAAALAVAGAVAASPEAFAQGRGQGEPGPRWRTHVMTGTGQALGPCRTGDSTGQRCQGSGPGMARGGQRPGSCSTGNASTMPCQGMAQGRGTGRGPGGGPRGGWTQQ